MHNLIDAIWTATKRLSLAPKLILGLLALSPLQAFALQNVTLAWDPSADPTVVGYYVYYGAASATYTNKVDVGRATTATLSNLVEGVTYYFALTAYNSASLESDPSNELSYTVPLLPPAITLLSPANSTTFSSPKPITCSASVVTNGHSITKVQFYNGTLLLGETVAPPYTLVWNCTNSGTYSLKARLVFDSGSTLDSAPASIKVKPAPPAHGHVVSVVGSGTVTPDLNTKALVVGNTYRITAVPDTDQQFAGWSGSITSSTPTLTFVLTSNFSVRATFVPAPVKALPAHFYGLFYESNRVEQSSSGAFVLSTTRRGRYSGYLQLGNTHLPFQGQLDAQGQGTNNLVRQNQSPLALQFSLIGGQQADQVQGTVAAETWVAGLTADRAGFSPKSNPSPLQGAYTLLIPGPQTSDPALPFGHSFGLVKVDAGGHVRLAANLADGTRLTQSAPLSSRGFWGLYAPLYAGQGSVLSWLAFTNRAADDFNGALSWIKPANRQARHYPGGFTNDCQALGSAYAPPVHNTLGAGVTNTSLSFTGGSLAADFANVLAQTSSRHLNNVSTNRLSLSVSRSTGAFRGSVTDPCSGKSMPFAGALFQKTQTGYGFLLGPSQSSQVELTH